MRRSLCAFVAAAGAIGLSSSALAQGELITFSFSDLAASFVDGPTMSDRIFSAQTVGGVAGLQSGGDITRVDVSPNQTATFPSGFAAGSSASVSVSMNLDTAVVNDGGIESIATTGAFIITDADGDVIFGNLIGSWRNIGGGFEVFEGLITSASILPGGGGDDLNFNAPAGGGSFSYAGLPMSGLTGAFVQLQLTMGTFFDQNFSGVSSQASGVLVPAPAAGGLLALAGLGAMRRRRR
jgi:MYXO-CTERM domain-containing protein